MDFKGDCSAECVEKEEGKEVGEIVRKTEEEEVAKQGRIGHLQLLFLFEYLQLNQASSSLPLNI